MDAADVNGDGLIDIVAASSWSDGDEIREQRLNVFLQDAIDAGRFLPPSRYLHPLGTLYNIHLSDFALNGLPAVIGRPYDSEGYVVFEQDPIMPGTYLTPVLFSGPSGGVFDIDVIDMDGDLHPDVVGVGNDGQILQFRQLATTPVSFTAAQYVVEGVRAVDAHDVDGDGVPDLVTFRENERDGLGGSVDVPDTVLVHLQDASQPGQYFSPVEIFFDKFGGDVIAADLNGDGSAEIVISATEHIDDDHTHHLFVYRQSSGLQFVLTDLLTTGGDILSGNLDVADVDGDGRLEIVAGYRNSALDPNLLEVFAQNSNGDYYSREIFTIPDDRAIFNPEMFAVRITDLDDDGLLDIVLSTYELFALFQNPAAPGTFRLPTRIAGQQ